MLVADSARDWPVLDLCARISELIEPTYVLLAPELLAVCDPVATNGRGFDLVGPADDTRRGLPTAIAAEARSSGLGFLLFVSSIAEPGRFVRDTPVHTSSLGGEAGDEADDDDDDDERDDSGFLLGFACHA